MRDASSRGSIATSHRSAPRSFPPVDPLDVGCGKLLPLRWSKFCAVYRYDRTGSRSPTAVEDKPFEMHVIVQTTAGHWLFHGKRGGEDIDRSMLVAGVRGDHYGCRHDANHPDSNLIASLRQDALDDDELPIFDREAIPLDLSFAFERALAAEDAERFESLVFEIFSVTSNRSGGSKGRSRGRIRMQRVKRFIEEYAFEDLTLRDIAASVSLSPFTCLRQLKSFTGMTPHAYVNRLRIQRARELLRSSKLEVAEIGRLVGITDPCYFSRWFVKETGVRPSKFRAG